MSLQPIRRTSAYMALAAATLLFAFDPAVTWWFPSCPLRALTGWLCPFCGSLRAIHALFHGAPGMALALNPLATVAAVGALAAIVCDVVGVARASWLEGWIGICSSARAVALAVAFGVFRNVPFDWMAR